ncbi:MAG TPA: hypothetical protein VHC22_16275 [Pirellulales bacterium]|nr:hypothetical protein [Pirellulales bacterium]
MKTICFGLAGCFLIAVTCVSPMVFGKVPWWLLVPAITYSMFRVRQVGIEHERVRSQVGANI